VSTPPIAAFEKMLASGKDSALLRFGLGNAYLKLAASDRGEGRAAEAVLASGTAARHLRKAVELDPAYSAAWKLLGRALTEAGEPAQALAAYRAGMEAARAKGDQQALREMQVFARRLERGGASG
jgi:predicted Zn-dependent protease